jgi:hypothetical protein
MNNWQSIISAGVAPIIVISACGLLCLALYNRLDRIVTRLRDFHREWLREQEALVRQRYSAQPDPIATIRHQEVLGMLQVQTALVERRAHLVRHSIGSLLLTIACLTACSLGVGLSALWPMFTYPAVGLFVVGLVVLVIGVVFAMMELKRALQSIELEGDFVTSLIADLEAAGRPPTAAESATQRLEGK